MTPTIVIGITADNAARAEACIDWVYQLSGRVKDNHILLAFDGDCTSEQRDRIKLTADLAFITVQELLVPQIQGSEIARKNHLFISAAEHCQKCFRAPWLWLEADCTPTNPEWLKNIAAEYDAQPYRYMGVHLKPNAESNERFLLRVAVYHMGCYNDIAKTCSERPEFPFEIAAGMQLVIRSSKCRLFQPLKINDESDFEKVWPEAQIVCGDSAGALIEHYRAEGVHLPKPIARAETQLGTMELAQPTEIDRRTKKGRALAAQKA